MVLGQAIKTFSAMTRRDIVERRSKRDLGNKLYHDLRKVSNRKESKYLLETLENAGKKYILSKTKRRFNSHGDGNDDLNPNSPVLIPFASSSNEKMEKEEGVEGQEQQNEEGTSIHHLVAKHIESIAQPIPSTSIFIPESTGVTYAMIGKSFSGKTTFIVNELNKLTEEQLRQYNVIVFFTESANAEPLQNLAPHVKSKMVMLDRFCPKILLVMKKLNDATKNMFKFLIIFDDILALRGELVTKCVATLRNSNISTAISIQHDKFINPAQRGSVHNMFIFNLRTESWEYMLRGFILGNVRQLIPPLRDVKSVMKVAQSLRETMDDYILYYNQRKDETFIWNKIA